MAFKLYYECEFCGLKKAMTPNEAEAAVCECEYKTEADGSTELHMTREERNERYRRQYQLNGYSWLGLKPWMYEGEL